MYGTGSAAQNSVMTSLYIYTYVYICIYLYKVILKRMN